MWDVNESWKINEFLLVWVRKNHWNTLFIFSLRLKVKTITPWTTLLSVKRLSVYSVSTVWSWSSVKKPRGQTIRRTIRRETNKEGDSYIGSFRCQILSQLVLEYLKYTGIGDIFLQIRDWVRVIRGIRGRV